MSDTKLEKTSDREIVITRTFAAPARIVFEAFTKAEHVKRWWAPRSHGAEMASVDADVRVGGAYRYVIRAHGEEMAFYGTYTEITPPTRLVYTQFFEPMADAGHVVVTVTFEDRGATTLMRSHEVYPSKQALETALSTGMESGMRETMDQLDALAQTMR